MYCIVVQCTFPKCAKKSAREEIWLLQGFFMCNFTGTGRCKPSLDTPLSRLSRMSKVYREFGAKIHVVETKVMEINAPLNLCHSN